MEGGRLSRFCLNRIASHGRTPSEAKPIAEGLPSSAACAVQDHEEHRDHEVHEEKSCTESDVTRKIMIVVDSSPEAKRAVLWALSHTVQDQDTLILLHVVPISKSSKQPGSDPPHQRDLQGMKRQMDLKDYEVLNTLKTLCNSHRPEVEVEILVVEGKEKGPAIVCQARKHSASLLVLGQRKPSILWRLLITWAGGKGKDGAGVVEYCIQNAECMTVAVRRKSKRVGGYLITTRRQQNFWLLA